MTNPDPIKYSDLIAYDDSIEKLISELNEVIAVYDKLKKDVLASASEAAKAMQGLSGATDEQRQAIAQNAQKAEDLAQKYRRLTDEEVQLKAAQQEVIAANREAVKMARLQKEAADAAEGSYKKLSAQYRINVEQLNKMSKAERENNDAGKKLEQQTKAIREEMSRLKKNTGDYRLEVGHYENALKNIPGPLGKVFSGMQNVSQSVAQNKAAFSGLAKSMGTSVGKLAAGVGVFAAAAAAAVGYVKLFVSSLKETQVTGDALQMEIEGLKGGFDRFKKSVATGDFSNLIDGIRESARAARELYKVLDEAFERQNSLMLQRSEISMENEVLLEDLRNQKLTYTERIAAGKQYLENVSGIYEREAKLAKDVADAELEYLFNVTNMVQYNSDEEKKAAKQRLSDFVMEYDINKDKIKQAGEYAKALQTVRNFEETTYTAGGQTYVRLYDYSDSSLYKENLQIVRQTSDEIKTLAEVLKQYNLTSNEQVSAYVEAQNKFLQSRSSMMRETRKVTTQINSLEAQLLKDEEKRSEEQSLLAEREKASREEVANSTLESIKRVSVGISEEQTIVGDYGKAVEKYYNAATNAVKKSGTESKKTVEEYYKTILEIYKKNEKKVADSLTAEMINSLQLMAGVLASAAENGTEDIWATVGAKSQEEAKQMAEQAAEDAKNIVIAANRAMKSTGDTMSWKFYEPNNSWSLIQPEPSSDAGTTTTTTTTPTKKPTTPTGGAWSLQGSRKYQEERLKLLRQMESGELESREAYEKSLSDLEEKMLEERLAKLRKGSSEAIKIEGELIERRTKATEKADALAKKADDDAVKAGLAYLNHQKESLQLEIAGTEKGTTKMLMLRLELIEKEREIELKLNREKAEEMRQDEALINAKYDRMRLEETQKTAEKAKEKAKSKESGGKDKASNLFDVFGIRLGTANESEEVLKEREAALISSIDTVKDSVSSLIDAWKEEAHAAVEAADAQIESAQKVLDAEREAAAQGYASNVARAQAELELAKKNREEALKEEEKAQRAQLAIDSITQASSLVTASANIWSSLSGIPVVGPALAVAALALMWGSFAASKIKAAQVAKESYGEGTVELLKGGSHASGNDIYLGTTDDGKERRAEGGEFFAIINKRSSRRYGAIIPDVINSFNDGTFADKYMRSGEAMKGYAVQMMVGADLAKVEDGIDAIRKQGEEQRTVENGYVVVRYKNLTRKIKS